MKILVTEEQFDLIIEHLKEESINNPEVLEEGFKDVVLGVALMMGLGLSGQSKAVAQKALSDQQILNQIKSTLQDKRIENIADSLEKSGVKNAMERIQQNADKFEGQLGIKLYKEPIKKEASTYKELAQKLKQGYAIAGISQDTIKQIIKTKFSKDPVVITETHEYDANNFFEPGKYELLSQAKSDIKTILDGFKDDDLSIIGIKIESSTDKQRVSVELNKELVNLGYPEGNEGLSKVRNDEVKEYVKRLGISDTLIKQDFKWNQGGGALNAPEPQDASARYIKIYLDAVKIVEEAKDVEIDNVVDVVVYNFELVKRFPKGQKVKEPKKTRERDIKQTLCNVNCPTF